jgi:hypothetical protein
MKNLELFKNSIAYAFNSTTTYFFRLLGYFLGGILVSAIFAGIFLLVLRIAIPFCNLGENGATVSTWLLVGLLYVGSFVLYYLLLLSLVIFQRNLLDLYDNKPFRGFSDKKISGSFFVTALFLLLMGLLKMPGGFAFMISFASQQNLSDLAWHLPKTVEFSQQYKWAFYALYFVGAYLSARLDSAYYIALESGRGVVASIKESWNLTRGKAPVFFSLYFITYLLGLFMHPLWKSIFLVLILPTYSMFYVYLYRTLSKGE